MRKTCKRKEPRYPARAIMVKLNGHNQNVFGYARDISRSGMQVRTFSTCMPYPICVGEKVSLEFRLPDCDSDIHCKAEIVWNRIPTSEQLVSMLQGVKFTEIDPAQEDALSFWLNKKA